MASPTTPQHGKLGAVYRLRPNNFTGDGLNDAAWGTGYSGAASAYYEVEIDGAGTPDTFKWRKDGGAWTEDVAVTGAAQTLDDDQTITFAATTGHTVADKWWIGNLVDEATTESGAEAQITESARRILNVNDSPVFTDSGGANVLSVDFTRGKAVFDANVANVDVDGANGYIPAGALEKVGYVIGWKFDVEVEMTDITAMGDHWEDQIAGEARATGSADGFFIGKDSWFDAVSEVSGGGENYFFIRLFNYDPDADATGDHFQGWAVITGVKPDAQKKQAVMENVTFKFAGAPEFVANA